MTKNNTTGTVTSIRTEEAVLSLLTAICCRAGHTMSWYTSKKGRVWLTVKGWQPVVYSTSVELDTTLPDQEVLDAFNVCLSEHIYKLGQERPPLTTWITRKAVASLLEDAEWHIQEIWRAWTQGVMFWEETYPDAPLPDPDEPSA